MDSLFDSVKAAVTMHDVSRAYGYRPNRAGYISCPFHAEKTPSLKLHERTFHCFGCGFGGTVIDFVAALFDLAPLDAARKLNTDFGLHLDEAPLDHAAADKRRRVQEAQQLFEEWREKMLNQFDVVIRVANLADYEDLSDAEATAIKFREAFEHWAGILLHGDVSQQMAIFRDRREVDRLCQTILNSTSTRSRTA